MLLSDLMLTANVNVLFSLTARLDCTSTDVMVDRRTVPHRTPRFHDAGRSLRRRTPPGRS